MKKYKFKDLREVKAEHVQHIVDLVKSGDEKQAAQKFHEFCLSVKELPQYEALMLADKIRKDAKK